MVADDLGEFVIAFTVDGDGGLERLVVLKKAVAGGENLHVDPKGVHIGNSILEVHREAGILQLTYLAVEAVPLTALGDSFAIANGGPVGVEIDDRHPTTPRPPPARCRLYCSWPRFDVVRCRRRSPAQSPSSAGRANPRSRRRCAVSGPRCPACAAPPECRH